MFKLCSEEIFKFSTYRSRMFKLCSVKFSTYRSRMFKFCSDQMFKLSHVQLHVMFKIQLLQLNLLNFFCVVALAPFHLQHGHRFILQRIKTNHISCNFICFNIDVSIVALHSQNNSLKSKSSRHMYTLCTYFFHWQTYNIYLCTLHSGS